MGRAAVIFGAGSVGRGFLGQLLCTAGWTVTFLDVDRPLVAALARDRAYPHITLGGTATTRELIGPVTALDARDAEPAVAALLAADLVATSVGARALGSVADTLAEGIRRRIRAGRPPLNVLLAENVHDCASKVRELLVQRLPEVPTDVLTANVGLIETSIGRMIPGPESGALPSEPTAVCAEPYRLLPHDAAAVVGSPLRVPGLIADPDLPFSYYSDRKLHVHNLGHCFAACLGRLAGLDLVWQAIARLEIRYLVRAAMLESVVALIGRYHAPAGALLEHVDDLLHRFANRALGDTNRRVVRDLERKLGPDDRLLGAYRMAAQQGLGAQHLSLAVAAGAALLLRQPGWDEQRLWAHLDAGLADVLDEPRQRLLATQISGLADGFDFGAQLALIEQTYEPSHVL